MSELLTQLLERLGNCHGFWIDKSKEQNWNKSLDIKIIQLLYYEYYTIGPFLLVRI